MIDTVIKNFPLNVMYLSVNEDGTYEIIDGQQRTISICQYVIGDFSVEQGVYPICGGHFELEEMDADHITPWSEGGHTQMENCQMLCEECNRRKGKK